LGGFVTSDGVVSLLVPVSTGTFTLPLSIPELGSSLSIH
jgi:hypothetical protein